jgi:hypothetical protein
MYTGRMSVLDYVLSSQLTIVERGKAGLPPEWQLCVRAIAGVRGRTGSEFRIWPGHRDAFFSQFLRSEAISAQPRDWDAA